MVLIVATFLSAIFSVAGKAKAGADPKECEVCIKVLEAIDSTIPSDEKTSKTSIEEGIDAYCQRKDLGQKEKKMCYYLEPIKRNVAHPFSLKMPKDRVCKRLKKDNDDICNVKYPVKVAQDSSAQDISKLRVKQLKQILNDRGVDCNGCLEKADFVKKVMDTAHMDL